MMSSSQAVGTDVQFGTVNKVNLWLPYVNFIIQKLMNFKVPLSLWSLNTSNFIY